MKIALASAFLTISFVSGLFAKSEVNAIAAIVNGKVVTEAEVKEAVKATETIIMMSIPAGSERNAELRKVRNQALDTLIERELILAEFEKMGGKIKDEIVDEDIKKIVRERFEDDQKKFTAELKKTGMSFARFRELRREMIAIQFMRGQQGKSILFATPAQVKAAYKENIDRFRSEGSVDLSTITIPKFSPDGSSSQEQQRKLIDTIRSKIMSDPSKFGELAKFYSADSAASEGGSRGKVDSKTMRPDLLAVAMSLKTGETSRVLEDQYNYYLLKANKRNLGAAASLEDKEVYEQAEAMALSELRKDAHDKWVAHLMHAASIKRKNDSGMLVSNQTVEKPSLPSGGTARPAPVATGGTVGAADPAPEVEEEKKKKFLPDGSRIRKLFNRD